MAIGNVMLAGRKRKIEVSVSSLNHDLEVKAPLYARAYVGEYWVVDLERRRLICHQGPRPDGWRTVRELRAGQRLASSFRELPELVLSELFAAAYE